MVLEHSRLCWLMVIVVSRRNNLWGSMFFPGETTGPMPAFQLSLSQPLLDSPSIGKASVSRVFQLKLMVYITQHLIFMNLIMFFIQQDSL